MLKLMEVGGAPTTTTRVMSQEDLFQGFGFGYWFSGIRYKGLRYGVEGFEQSP